jgi:AcrR family transcriptional regulator
MSASSLVEMARAYIEREQSRRREHAEARVLPIRKRLTAEGEFRLVHPGVIWEACQTWLEETRRFGHDVVEHVLRHPHAPSLLGQPDEVERFRRFIAEWLARELDEYIMPSCVAFMKERGIQVEQEVRIIRHRAEMVIAQVTKDLLARIHLATRRASAVS